MYIVITQETIGQQTITKCDNLEEVFNEIKEAEYSHLEVVHIFEGEDITNNTFNSYKKLKKE